MFLEYKESEYISDDEGLLSGNKKADGSCQEGDVVVDDSDGDGVSETFFDDIYSSPFNNYRNESEEDHSMSHPPGFTLAVSRQDNACLAKGVESGVAKENSSAKGVESGVAKENSSGVYSKVMSHAEEGQDNEALN
nr:hypothetical protein [Tanacetum cinerariifolium]